MSKDQFGSIDIEGERQSDDYVALVSPEQKRETPFIVFVYIILAAGANLLFGYENTNVSGAKLAFAHDYDIDTKGSAYGFIAAAMATGATISCPFAGLLQDRFGRRITLILACIFYIGSVCISSTAHGYSQMVGGRVLTGMAIGVFSSTAPMFISELAPPAMRGRSVDYRFVHQGVIHNISSLFLLLW